MIPGVGHPLPPVRQTALSRLHPATLLGLVLLLIVATIMAEIPVLVTLALLQILALGWTGLGPGALLVALRPWSFLALLVLGVHTFTTVSSAPLGHPSWGGLLAGLEALARLLVSVGWLALAGRLKSLDGWVRGARWWLRPLEAMGLPTGRAALVLAVALGTVPRVMGEGARVASVQSMRRSLPGQRASRRRRFQDRLGLATPLLEGLMRRAETLSLSLRTRQPDGGPVKVGPPWWQLVLLVAGWGLLAYGEGVIA